MNVEMEVDDPPHRWVAEKLGMSISGVSLLRSGRRQPSMETMETVEDALGWPLCDQVADRHNYALSLKQALRDKFNQEASQPIPGQTTIEEIEDDES